MAKHVLSAIALLAACSHGAHALRASTKEADSLDVNESKSAATCSEKAVTGVCDCEYYKRAFSVAGYAVPNALDAVGVAGHYQCSGCQDKSKWGFGCDMECPDCAFGCDFSGDCIAPRHCVTNWRVNGKDLINSHGECAACEDGYSGPICEDVCPENCGGSSEGKCTRGGKCYKCKRGFFGEDCSQECPAACPDCVMQDKYADDDQDGQRILLDAAGTCPNDCNVDAFGPSCDQPCPQNCHKVLHSFTSRLGLGVIPSCFKESGVCKKCSQDKWWGKSCEQKCPSVCEGGTCDRAQGICTKGCEIGSGKWGQSCDQDCPTGCGKGGLPHLFERVLIKASGVVGRIESVMENNGIKQFKVGTAGVFSKDEVELWQPACNRDTGICRDACKAGFFGLKCDIACPDHTHPDSGCDRSTGAPEKCADGFYVKDGICEPCSDTCANGMCNEKGECTSGCEVGFHGKDCKLSCPSRCEGSCDAMTTGLKDGRCKSCSPGFTGRFCTEKCHPTCLTCASWSQAGPLATSKNACTSCREKGYNAEPVLFTANSVLGLVPIPPFGFGSCDCIEGASRSEGSSECTCDPPEDPKLSNFEERFELTPKKTCRFVCKEGLREVFGHQHSICISNNVYKAVVKAEAAGWKQGNCKNGSYEIPMAGNETECIQEDHVQDIISEEA